MKTTPWEDLKALAAEARGELRKVPPPSCDNVPGNPLYYPLLFVLDALDAFERWTTRGLIAACMESEMPEHGLAAEAAAAEREACALICEEMVKVSYVTARELAEAIRGRGSAP